MDTTRTAQSLGDQAKETMQDMSARAKAAGNAAWERTKTGYAYAQDKVVTGAKATDRVIRDNPYQAIGIAFGVGLLLGFLVKRR